MLLSVGVPYMIVHLPLAVATLGALAASVKEVTLHSFWSGPAAAGAAMAYFTSVTSSELAAQVPLVMVQRSITESPGANVTVVVGLVGEAIVGEPYTTVHLPVPTVGVLAAIVRVEAKHAPWSGPASAVVGS
jgi:hypothetical protein